jgi:hypothetical protein
MAELMLGFGPAKLCAVSMFLTAADYDGGSIDLMLNLTNGFYTGKSPVD